MHGDCADRCEDPEWGSDVAAHMLRRFGIEYIALNPGASIRGLHDSLVNYLGNRAPEMLLCLHEDSAVAIAHGYAKATDRPMAVALHANVGLMHALLGIFNAWCDRLPMFVVGANGPFDTSKRRPWIDWIHTHKDQGALLRHSVKWDDEPRSVEALIESMLRANRLMRTCPQGPVYVCLDGALQELRLADPAALPDFDRFAPPPPPVAPAAEVARVADLLAAAERPLLLFGRCSRSQAAWEERVQLAETSDARVATDLKSAAAFPTDHPLHIGGLTLRISPQVIEALREADLVIAFDWIDEASLLRAAGPDVGATIVSCSLDAYLHGGASMEHYGLAPADIVLQADPEALVTGLVEALQPRLQGQPKRHADALPVEAVATDPSGDIDSPVRTADIGEALNRLRDRFRITLARVPIAWDGDVYPLREPLDFLGYDGGGGLSSGPGNTIGAALGLRDTDRRVVGILGDGDFMQAASALWTAARYSIPALFVIANNRSNLTDVAHQKTIARRRGRAEENSGVGQHIDDPDIDLVALARAQGVDARGPIQNRSDLLPALEWGLSMVAAGRPCLLDVRIERE